MAAKSRYVALLRGVNVGGKMLSMPALRELCVELGFEDIETYIQSGNLIFTSGSNAKKAGSQIEQAIAERMSMDVTVLIRSPAEMQKALETNPFADRRVEANRLHVTFLAGEADKELVKAVDPEAYLPDEFAVIGLEVYLLCPNGYGTSKLGNAFWERKLKVRATTRNWKTVQKLVEMASA